MSGWRGMKQAITFPAFFLTLVGFMLVLLVTLSVPIIHSINMLHASQTVTGSSASVGVFGACYTQAQNFATRKPEFTTTCSGTDGAYTVNDAFFGTTQTVVRQGLSGGLIMNVIACGFAGVAFLMGLFGWLLRSRPLMVVLFIFVILGAIFEWLAFWINLGFVLNTRSHIHNYTGGLWTGHIGNAFWLSFGSAMALSFAVCFAGVGAFSEEEKRERNTPVPQVHEKPGRRWPWQKRRNSATASEVAPVAAYPANAGV
ncbi:hypothetical protein JCM24511_07337 [Saitozyma sp. JCM 24511]|nr:hypothetical protein JCM24511_07337 [Saitozyma sp. JCM 24511]